MKERKRKTGRGVSHCTKRFLEADMGAERRLQAVPFIQALERAGD